MSTSSENKELFSKLKKPFHSADIEWRIGSTNKDKTRGVALPYLKFPAIADRLDEVLSEENWKTDYVAGPAGGVVCRLSLRINDEWICKENGAANTEMEGVKGGLTDAFKRVAATWGIGRYLHSYEALWVDINANTKEFQIPALPDNMLPPEEVEANRKAAEALAAEVAEKKAAAAGPAVAAPESSGTAEVSKPAKPAKPDVAKETKAAVAETKETPAESAIVHPAAPGAADEVAESTKAEAAPAEKTEPAAQAAAEQAAAPAAEEKAAVATAGTPVAVSTTIAVGAEGLPVMPEGLPEPQVKRIEQLVERIFKGIPVAVIREYIVDGKGKDTMVEAARNYVLARLEHHEKALAIAANAA